MTVKRANVRSAIAGACATACLIAGFGTTRAGAADSVSPPATVFQPKALHKFVFNAMIQIDGNPSIPSSFDWSLRRAPQHALTGRFEWPANSDCHSPVGSGSTLKGQSLYLIGTCKRIGPIYFNGTLDFTTGTGQGTLSSPFGYTGTWTSSPDS